MENVLIKRPALYFIILIILGLIVIVTYKIYTDPFKNAQETGVWNSAHNDNLIYSLYMENCTTCHGREGQGQSGFPSLVDLKLDIDSIKKIILNGQGDMPAFPTIEDPQLSQLAEMIKQFSK